jgi:MoxR-like ATPase
VYVDPAVSRYALEIAVATRRLESVGLEQLAPYVSYGASPRGPINLVLGARALALLRGRRYALPQDVRELAKDVLRHRMVLSYEALAEGVEADTVLDRVLEAVSVPQLDLSRGAVA